MASMLRRLSTSSFSKLRNNALNISPRRQICSLFTASDCARFVKTPQNAQQKPVLFSKTFELCIFQQRMHFHDVDGPVILNYSAIIPEEEFHQLADDLLQNLQEKLEEYGDSLQIDGFDIDYSSGVLTVKLGDLGTYVINKQTPNRQIWLSSPVSGPARFDWDKQNQAWIYRRTKADLSKLLETELSGLLKTSFKLE